MSVSLGLAMSSPFCSVSNSPHGLLASQTLTHTAPTAQVHRRGLLCLSMGSYSSGDRRSACRLRFSLLLILSSLRRFLLPLPFSLQPARLTTHAAETLSAIICGHVSMDRPSTLASLRLAWRIRIRCAKVRQEGLPGALRAARPPRWTGHRRLDAAFHPLLIACL